MRYMMCMASIKAQEGIVSLIAWMIANAIECAKKMWKEFVEIVKEENKKWEEDWRTGA